MAHMAMYDVLTIGEINADLILGEHVKPVFGQVETLVDDATLTLGSSGVIFACGCARLGLSVAYCGVVGDDIFGRFMLDAMEERGVETAGVVVNPATKTGLSVILDDGVDRAILTHLGSIDEMAAEQVDRSLLARSRHIHVTSYFLQSALQPGLAHLLKKAQSAGSTVSMDTNWDPAERWNHGLAGSMAATDLFLPNAQEALAITGETNLDRAEELLSETVATVAIKLGAGGARCRSDSEWAYDPGFAVDVVDTTGAGDSFDAGFIYGYTRGMSVTDTLALANACGALSTRKAGGTDAQATWQEAQSMIRQRDEEDC